MPVSPQSSGGAGPLNHLLDLPGLRLGHAHDPQVSTGVTLILADYPMTAAVDVRGGAPGTKETDLLGALGTVEQVDALVLSGGSAFGLEASSAIAAGLAKMGRGFAVGPAHVPIVPQAILFDLLDGGAPLDPSAGLHADLGRQALSHAISRASDAQPAALALGRVGAGYGATTAAGRGGLGAASYQHPDGWCVAALVAVNAVGSPYVGAGPHFWAAPWELNAEFGGLGPALQYDTDIRLKNHDSGGNTSIGVVATDLPLTQKQLRRLVAMAHNGLARALRPSHTPLDGDTLFGLATSPSHSARIDLGLMALAGERMADCVTRATARGVWEAQQQR